MRWSSTLVMTSPRARPASAPVEPGVTCWICAPSGAPVGLATSETVMPSRAWVGVSPLTIWSTIGITSSIGMAKPRPIEPPWSVVDVLVVLIAASMPTTWPARSTSGPPLLPGLIAASVWIAGYVVLLPWPSEPTSTGRSSALTMPLVTVDSSPNGEPIATTPWPTAQLGGLADRGRGEPVDVLGLDHGGVGERVGAEDLGRRRACRR